MTLNITIMSPTLIVQVSDRRMVDMTTNRPFDDEANKALVLHCADAVLTLTFAGIGKAGDVRTDLWLAESLQDAGAAELDSRHACAHIADAASTWFRTFPSTVDKRHTFVVAGWCDRRQEVVSKCWRISNMPEGRWASGAQTLDRFSVYPVPTSRHASRVVATGLVEALNRKERKRLIASLRRRAGTAEGIELSVVEAIRRAASDATWSWGIGQNCTAVALSPAREARGMYYGSAGAPRTYGPNVLWYYGGRNYLVADMDALPSGNYAVGFGGGPTPIKLVVSSAAAHLSPDPLSAQKLVTGFKVRVVDARHRTKDPIEPTALCQLIPMHGQQPAQPRGKSA